MKIQVVISKIAKEIVKFKQSKQQSQVQKIKPPVSVPTESSDKLDVNA